MTGKDRIPAENLAIWREAAAQSDELRCLQAALMARDVGAHLSKHAELTPALLPEPLREGADAVATAREQVAFCATLVEAVPDLGKAAEQPARLPAHPRVALLSGPVFAGALQRFSPLLSGARPLHLSSLSDLLEEVAAGRADLALLPMEDAKGTRFLHFYEEFDRLELRVICTCSLPAAAYEQSARFALIAGHRAPCTLPQAEPMMDCRLACEEPSTLYRLLAAADAAGASLRRLDSLPTEAGTLYFPTFAADHRTQQVLEVYMALCLPRATVVGRYFHLQEGEQK